MAFDSWADPLAGTLGPEQSLSPKDEQLRGIQDRNPEDLRSKPRFLQ
jgi:hypothetical protein